MSRKKKSKDNKLQEVINNDQTVGAVNIGKLRSKLLTEEQVKLLKEIFKYKK